MLSIVSLFLINQLKAQRGEGCFFTTCTNTAQVRINAIIDPVTGDFMGGCYCDCPPTLECLATETLNKETCTCVSTASPPAPAPANPSPANPSPANPGGAPVNVGNRDLYKPPAMNKGFQSGLGCPETTCPGAKVRVDAILDAVGEFVGGCTCECSHNLWDETSLDFCAPPDEVNSECICGPPSNPPPAPPAPANPPPAPKSPTNPAPAPKSPANPGPAPAPKSPANPGPAPAPKSPGNPSPVPPVVVFPGSPTLRPAPVPTPPTVDIPATALCDTVGPCACPAGTTGTCTIMCEGIDGCKDGIIDCNNDGYPCIVECAADEGCSGTSTITGPRNGALTISCTGEKSCEGALTVNAATGTDLNVQCDGITSCKGGIFNFGQGVHSVGCNGEPGVTNTCQDLLFNLPANAETTIGMAFACTGLTCPPNTPAAFDNTIGPKNANCAAAGDCGCKPGTNEICTINCDGGPDACKDGLIECNNNGFDCIVNCIADNACAGSAMITGPTNGRLTVNCRGIKACEGSVVFDGEFATDMTVICRGNEACKGSPVFNYGTGLGTLECNGQPDTCLGAATFNMQPGTESRFVCSGNACPSNVPGAAATVV